MTHAIRTLLPARGDVVARVRHYRSVDAATRAKFLAALKNAYKSIAGNPYMFAQVGKGARAAHVRKFQDVIYYTIQDDVVVVFAILHGRRHPNEWKRRLKAL